MTAMTGSTRRYGALQPATRRPARRHRQGRAAEEARNRLALGMTRHHELLRDLRVFLAGAARVPGRSVVRGRAALRVDSVRERVPGAQPAGVEGRRSLRLGGSEEGL